MEKVAHKVISNAGYINNSLRAALMCEKLPKVGQAYMCILVVPHIYDAKYVH
jgi:hypothetical protein